MDIKINTRDLKKFLDLRALTRFITEFLYKKLQLIAMLIIISATLFLVFLWYSYIFNSTWDETKINSYIQTKQEKNDTIFGRDNFEKITEESKAREEEFNRKLENLNDIFRLNNPKEPNLEIEG
jgi:LPS O-antigen subunit length determinant protein (WzzB/FepE family)